MTGQTSWDGCPVIELERSGIRDGDGCWHGSDAMGGIVREMAELCNEWCSSKYDYDQRGPGDMTEIITIETSCGRTFERSLAEMADWQLRGLLQQNPDHQAALSARQFFTQEMGAFVENKDWQT